MQPMTAIRAIAISLALGAAGLPALASPQATATPGTASVQMQHIRNATTKIDYAGKTFLVDPLLAKKGAYPGFEGTFRSDRRNPLVELPMPAEDVMKGVDAVIVTHTHLDHWDGGEHQFVPKAITLFAQNEADAKIIRGQGFTDVRVMGENTVFEGVRLTRTGGQHGTDEMYANGPLAGFLGTAMGIVFQASGSPTVYLVGDTVWRSEVDQSLAKFKPDVVILNAGEARLVGYAGSIIMSKDDVLRAYKAAPNATIVAVHMDAINHMTLSREQLRDYVHQNGIQDRVRIPADGETLKF
ncbi:MBL fold metallo-hydrolase [Microvirga makkahensis]|uniref:MBL fold metallo-hydrolase n=1 Tax=Microvirga makkahensis TaxID=1128670 RepID=A0A7X3SR34_9HYPH|nr:MBL fold metallo-hydrolase [Microvirga makkahensis]MXQ14147.1 MBL fold metallo-hydrolase [Microvirga makkahensis]